MRPDQALPTVMPDTVRSRFGPTAAIVGRFASVAQAAPVGISFGSRDFAAALLPRTVVGAPTRRVPRSWCLGVGRR
jgi:hypothetical protein